jgi:hypothetical protein
MDLEISQIESVCDRQEQTTVSVEAPACKRNKEPSPRSKAVNGLLANLQGQDQVVVPTDKTNSFRLVDSTDYIRWVKAHLNASAKVVSRHHLMEVLQSGQDLLDEMEGLMGEKEVKFVKQSLLSKQIPTPLLIKDHKKPCSTNG